MRVSFLLRYFTIGGLERVVVSLANAYYSKGIDVDIIVVSKGKRNSLITELNPNIKINFLEGTFFNKIIELRRYTKGRLVHVNFGDGKIHPLLRCFIFDRLKIITYHSNYSHKRNKIKNLLDKWWFNNFKHIVAVSDSVKDFCLNEIKYPNNITVIKNAIQDEITNISKANWSSDKSVLKIVSLSSLYPHKNHKLLINSLGILKEKYPDVNVEISIIGDGPCLSELYQTSIKLGLNNIRWYGAIWDKKLVGNILQQSDLYELLEKEYKGYQHNQKNIYREKTLQELCLGLHSMCIGTESKYFNGHTNIVDDKFLCFGVKGLMDTNRRLKDAMLFNVLSYMTNELLDKGNTVAAIDELYLFLTNMTAIEYIRNASKRVRKKDSAVILASQNIEDFMLDGIREYTKPLFSIPTHQFLFNAGNIEPKVYIDTMQLEQSEFELIKYPERGTCLYRCGNERYLLQVIAPEFKQKMFGKAGGR